MMKPDFPGNSPERIERIPFLIQHYIFEDLTPDENEELQKWVSQKDEHQRIFEEATNQKTIELGVGFLKETDVNSHLQRIKEKLSFVDTGAPAKVYKLHMKRWLSAACF